MDALAHGGAPPRRSHFVQWAAANQRGPGWQHPGGHTGQGGGEGSCSTTFVQLTLGSVAAVVRMAATVELISGVGCGLATVLNFHYLSLSGQSRITLVRTAQLELIFLPTNLISCRRLIMPVWCLVIIITAQFYTWLANLKLQIG